MVLWRRLTSCDPVGNGVPVTQFDTLVVLTQFDNAVVVVVVTQFDTLVVFEAGLTTMAFVRT